MKLVVGLGNPGSIYAYNIHNIGYLLVDFIAQKRNLSWVKKTKLQSYLAISKGFILCKSFDFMNLTGMSVFLLKQYYKISTENILIIHDDLDLAFLKIKLKFGGSSAGHNGIKSIDSCLKTKNYYRLRFGVGRPIHQMTISKYVLSNFTSEQLELVNCKISQINDFFNLFIDDKIDLFHNKLSLMK